MDTSQQNSNTIDNIASVITNKRSRSLMFLVLTFVLILLANGLLPLISGQAHYTAEIVDVTYIQYKQMKKENKFVDLSYGSLKKIDKYINAVIESNEDITPEEAALIEPPDLMVVEVYTKFFFQSLWWYFDTALSMVSGVSLFYAIFNYLIVREKDKREDHINGEYLINQLNESYLDPDTFEPWMEDDFNKKRKIKQHIRNVRYDLKVLEMKTPFVTRRRFKKHFDNLVEVAMDNTLPALYHEMTDKEREYVNKKEELLMMLDDSYIEEFVIHNDVKNFKEIKPGFVYSGVNVEGVGQDEYSSIKTDTERIKSTILSKILMTLSMTLVFASLLTVVAVNINHQPALWIIITVILKIVPLFLQIYFAIDYTNWFMENQLLPNLKFRYNIAMIYLAEMKRRGVLLSTVVLNKITVKNVLEGDKENAKTN